MKNNIFFCPHIPKTGGSSFFQFLIENFPKNNIFSIYKNISKENKNNDLFFSSTKEKWSSPYDVHTAAKIYNPGLYHFNKNEIKDKIKSMIKQSTCVEDFIFIVGHFNLRDIDFFEIGNLVTWIRNPLQGRVSEFYFYKRKNIKTIENELDKFIKNHRNHYKFYLNNIKPDKFFFIGETENFDNDLNKFCKKIGFIPKMQKRYYQNVGTKTPWEVSKEDKSLFNKLNKEDIEYYNQLKSTIN